MNDLLTGLNTEQQEAVKHTDGALLIMAGAGSGKTRVLTHRIAYLLKEKDVSPRSVLAITFTNKAAREMKDRVQKLVGAESQQIWVSTFNRSVFEYYDGIMNKLDIIETLQLSIKVFS